MPLRLEYLDGDGPSFVDYADWRDVKGRKIAFRNTLTDGDHRFDTVQQTTSVRLDEPVDPAAFAPLVPRLLATDRVHTIPLVERGGHVGVTVRIANKDWFFILDTGAQSILVDSAVLKAAGVDGAGALEVRGASRSGGLTVATLPRLEVDGANMDDVVVSSLDIARNLGGGLRIDGILGYPFFASARRRDGLRQPHAALRAAGLVRAEGDARRPRRRPRARGDDAAREQQPRRAVHRRHRQQRRDAAVPPVPRRAPGDRAVLGDLAR